MMDFERRRSPHRTGGPAVTDQELNAAVAIEVMGWELSEPHMYSPDGHWIGDKEERDKYDFQPATTWEGTGQVIERMRELGWNAQIDVQKQTGVTFFQWQGEFPPMYLGKAPTFPEAVCLAALAAVRAAGMEGH